MRIRVGAAIFSLCVAMLVALLPGGCIIFDGLVAAGPDVAASVGRDAAIALDAQGAGEDAAAPGEDAASGPPGYLPVADAVRVCTLAFSCKNLWNSIWTSLAVPVDHLNFSLCVDWLAGPLAPSHLGISLQRADLACIAKASTCAAAGSCLAFETLEPGDPRCPPDAGTSERCFDDTTIVMCASPHQAWHCDNGYYAPNQHCMVASDGWHYCAESTGCSTYGCIGQLFYGCWGAAADLEGASDCLHNGEACGGIPDSGLSACLTDGKERLCTGLSATCAGAKIEVCDALYISQYDCAELEGTCSAAAGVAACRRSNDTCTVSDSAINVCQPDGTTVSLCVGGQRVDFDCASLGAGKVCKPQAGAVSGHCG